MQRILQKERGKRGREENRGELLENVEDDEEGDHELPITTGLFKDRHPHTMRRRQLKERGEQLPID